MPVVLDGDAGERVLIYGADGSTLRKIAVDSSGRLVGTDGRERSPLQVLQAFEAGGVAPHGTTERWTYTVPAAKKADVEMLELLCERDGATATPAAAANFVDITPSGGAEARTMHLSLFTPTVGVNQTLIWGGRITLLAGDRIRARTADPSTGGTVKYFSLATIIEYDA